MVSSFFAFSWSIDRMPGGSGLSSGCSGGLGFRSGSWSCCATSPFFIRSRLFIALPPRVVPGLQLLDGLHDPGQVPDRVPRVLRHFADALNQEVLVFHPCHVHAVEKRAAGGVARLLGDSVEQALHPRDVPPGLPGGEGGGSEADGCDVDRPRHGFTTAAASSSVSACHTALVSLAFARADALSAGGGSLVAVARTAIPTMRMFAS